MSVAEVAASPLRNRLTRSFRGKIFMKPDVALIDIEGEENFVIATDGFWARLAPEDYSYFLSGERPELPDPEDDCSALVIKIRSDVDHVTFAGEVPENVYFSASE